MLDRANNQIRDLMSKVNRVEPENERLRSVERDYYRVCRVIGKERVDEIVTTVKEHEISAREQEVTAWKSRQATRDCTR